MINYTTSTNYHLISIVFLKSLQINCTTLRILIILICFITKSAIAKDGESSVGITNFAFSSYLGTGFYTTSGQDVFVLQLPFEHIIMEKTETEAGWVLNLPLTVGFINFSNVNIENLPELDDVGTLTFLPGLEYQYPVTPNWTVIPFADYGFARDFNFTTNVLITGIGVKSYAHFHHKDTRFTLGNRFLYARERSKKSSNDSDYSLVETGLSYRLTNDISFNDKPLYTNLYYIYFYYPDELVFFERTTNPIRVGNEHEIGLTFSNIPDFLFFEKPQLGLGIRIGDNVTVYRLVFGMPF